MEYSPCLYIESSWKSVSTSLFFFVEEEVFVGVSSGNCRVFPLFSETSSHFWGETDAEEIGFYSLASLGADNL